MQSAVAKVEDAILVALARGDTVDAHALHLLLRRYESSADSDAGTGDLADILGRALAAALEFDMADTSIQARAAWIALFAEAAALSDDERFAPAIGALASALRPMWKSARVADSTSAIEGCLHASSIPAFESIAADAIDELERIIGRTYEPGENLGSIADQVCAASTLLTAYGLSGRLPYSMLAEELIQPIRREDVAEFFTACTAARVLTRLAILHADDGYQAAAIVAPGVDYRADAGRLLRLHEDEAVRRGAAGAIYGLAVLELESTG